MSRKHSTDGCFRSFFKNLEDPAAKFELEDSEPIILDLNDAFAEVFGNESTPIIGESLNDLIVPATDQKKARQFDQRTQNGEVNKAIVERMTETGRRKFLYRGIPIGGRLGFAIYSDITEEIQRKHHLEVLHRVMRHNLRNDLTIIFGMIEDIIRRTEDECTRAAAEKIRRTARGLEELSDEASTIQSVLEEPSTVKPIEVNTIVNELVADYRERTETEATIINKISPDLVVTADNRLQTALRSLLDNAIRYNDSPHPQVAITEVELSTATVEIQIIDNGPGIPSSEKQLINDYQQMSEISHNSGLGLWLAKLIINSYGGSIDIETPDDCGTLVSIQLNRHC